MPGPPQRCRTTGGDVTFEGILTATTIALATTMVTRNRFATILSWAACCGAASGLAGMAGTPSNLSGQELRTVSATNNGVTEALYAELAADAEAVSRNHDLLKKLVRTCQPSVAHIEARKSSPPAGNNRSAAHGPVIEEAGSGVLFRHRNRLFIITNYHVVDGAQLQDIRLVVDETMVRAVDIRHDPESDLSVMLLEENDLVPSQLGDSSKVEIGEPVVVIGSPFGLSHSVSSGIISASHRRDLELGPQGVIYQDFFQTDASINPGNSGGPLLNLRGEVIGINTAIASNSGGSDGIGFAIPINMALRIVTDLIDHGSVRRGHLGVSMDSNFTPEVALSLGLRKTGGTRITAVAPGSPAAEAKLLPGDVVLDFGGVRIGSDAHLKTLVSLASIGETVPMQVFRNGEFLTLQVVVRPQEPAAKKPS